ncbi:unnamed protein product [Cyclocybe aegerita]|uniref:FHA domain-containing protein n=1 Tax=Cyclocybe aegerita TaxID=1973307 RepID=A0A8S0X731_CYCAE|nr:unnamed protein product [Cyclocybe aegerita]
MPAPAPFPPQNQPATALYPALYLYPLNDTWAPKHIALTNQHTKIGRQTSSKTAPGERNGFFDSKVLSRQHAEVWEENGKVSSLHLRASSPSYDLRLFEHISLLSVVVIRMTLHFALPLSDYTGTPMCDLIDDDPHNITSSIASPSAAAPPLHLFYRFRSCFVLSPSVIFIKDVKSSNGTFINGERLSSEGHESEPFELKSDDIVEFGIDIIGEDNKTIIHHKVAARVVCVFSEQDAQVAARAEQHQQQQHLQQQQYLQQQASTSGLGGPSSLGQSVNGVNGGMGAQNFPFASAQRRAQLAQQGLGGMGGMRPPGKTGLSFEVVLSRLQGELQKSRETGAELTSLTGAMGDICDTLGGNVPSALPSFPATLPPVRPSQEPQQPPQQSSSSAPAPHGTSSPSPPSSDPPAASSIPVAAISDIQAQLRELHESQSTLTAHLERIRALEGVVDEQENVRREVRALRGLLEERSREEELLQRRVREHHEQEPRDGFDEDEEEMVGDDDDDARSISTVIPHELERVDEEDEEGLEDIHHSSQDPDSTHHDSEGTHDGDAHAAEHTEENAEEQERRRAEDLEVSRPRTPEPTRIMGGLRESDSYPGSGPSRTGLLGAPGMARRSSVGSPLSQEVSSTPETVSDSSTSNAVPPEEIYAQLSKLSQQVGAVVALTTSLEAQHSKAQNVIKELEDRVGMLEGLLKEARSTKDVREPAESESSEDSKHSSLVSMITEWKKSVEGQWTAVQEEWTSERERLAKAREEWVAKARAVDSGLERMDSGIEKMTKLQERVDGGLVRLGKVEEGFERTSKVEERVGKVEDRTEKLEGTQRSWGDERRDILDRIQSLQTTNAIHGQLSHHLSMANGDVLKHNGGLVTPPSPRSQSSDSAGRYGRRRRSRKSSGSRGRSSSRGRASSGSRGDLERDEDADTDATLASSTEGDVEKSASRLSGTIAAAARALATPEPSVYKLSSSIGSLDSSSQPQEKGKSVVTTRSNTEDTASLKSIFERLWREVLMPLLSSLSALLSCVGIDNAQNLSGLVSEERSTGTVAKHGSHPQINVQTAVGVVLLSVAAAAVFWKVKPE